MLVDIWRHQALIIYTVGTGIPWRLVDENMAIVECGSSVLPHDMLASSLTMRASIDTMHTHSIHYHHSTSQGERIMGMKDNLSPENTI
jgi:hypothetical protein